MADQVTYGGQAVIEGVMMRGPRHFAVACRRANGEIQVRREAVPAFFTRYRWAKWPFLRGVFALADALVLGMKSLLYSADLAMEDEQAKDRPGPGGTVSQVLIAPLLFLFGAAAPAGSGAPGRPTGGSISSIAVTGSAITGLALGIGLFMLAPSVVAGWASPWISQPVWRSVLEGGIRVAFVLGYILAISRMKQVRRLFQYHGAEHQAINALETDGRLDVETAMRASRFHPRCGTNFILTVLIVKALIFTLIPWQEVWHLRLGLRLALLPVVGSVAFELIRLAGRYRQVAPLQWIVLPGVLTQRLTTREPDREMVEVAVASLEAVIEVDGARPEAKPEPVPAIA